MNNPECIFAESPAMVIAVHGNGNLLTLREHQEEHKGYLSYHNITPVVKAGDFVETGQLIGYTIPSEVDGPTTHFLSLDQYEEIIEKNGKRLFIWIAAITVPLALMCVGWFVWEALT